MRSEHSERRRRGFERPVTKEPDYRATEWGRMIREEVIRTSVIQHIVSMRESLDEGITSNVRSPTKRTKDYFCNTR